MKVSDPANAELKALDNLPDSQIDTSDIPEVVDWTGAVRGRFYRGAERSGSPDLMNRMSEEQKIEIRRLLGEGRSRFEIAEKVGATPGQVSAIKAHIAMGTYASDSTESDELLEAVETTFGLERDLQQALRKNIGQLEPGLTIIDGDREHTVRSGGRIDIVAKDHAGGTVVIELTAGLADRDAIGQILAYMGDLMEGGNPVRGILIAGEFSSRTIAAARAAPNVRLVRYGFRFSFQPVPSPTVTA